MNIDFDFACRDDCLDRMGPSDLRLLVAERDQMRGALKRIIRDAERAKISHWITRADAIEHIMRLARYAGQLKR